MESSKKSSEGTGLSAVILAGGKGSRMKAERSKVLMELAGKPLLRHIAETCRESGVERLHVVTGENDPEIRAAMRGDIFFHRQHNPLGTGHALMTAAPFLTEADREVFVLMGDAPLLTPSLLGDLLAMRRETNAAATILTAVFEVAPPYGRVIRDPTGSVLQIVEEPECTLRQKEIREVFTAPYCLDWPRVKPFLAEIPLNRKKGEYNLTELIGILTNTGLKVAAMHAPEPMETLGLNTLEDLARAKEWLSRG